MKHLLILLSIISATPAWAGVAVVPAKDQQTLLASTDHHLAANKKLVYDFSRIILAGRRLDQAVTFLSEDYTQHIRMFPMG
jgi:hypothetical protein